MIKRKFDKESILNLKRDFLSYYELLENCNNMSKLEEKISELNSKIGIDSLSKKLIFYIIILVGQYT